MPDIGFWEMAIIAVIALLVIGPDRLPAAARTVGHYVGKFQRMVTGVKQDFQAEMDRGELRKLLGEQESQLNELRTLVTETKRELNDSAAEAARGIEKEVKAVEHASEGNSNKS